MKTDKKYWHDVIRERLKRNQPNCLACLYPDNDWIWGHTRENLKKTVALMNTLLKDIPVEAWPKDKTEDIFPKCKAAHNNWVMELFWNKKQRQANLVYRRDDHTAWVREYKKGVFGNCDIGGS